MKNYHNILEYGTKIYVKGLKNEEKLLELVLKF
jgi:hypothetical protein